MSGERLAAMELEHRLAARERERDELRAEVESLKTELARGREKTKEAKGLCDGLLRIWEASQDPSRREELEAWVKACKRELATLTQPEPTDDATKGGE